MNCKRPAAGRARLYKVGQTCAIRGHEQVDTIECESAEAARATLLIGGREVAMIFADVRRRACAGVRYLML